MKCWKFHETDLGQKVENDPLVGDLVSFRGPFFVKSNLECLTCSLYVSKPKKLGLKIRATVFGRFWANLRAKNKNTNF